MQPSKNGHKPEPRLIIQCGNQEEEASAVRKSFNPLWEQYFKFWICNPEVETIRFILMDDKIDKAIGVAEYNLSHVLHAPGMELKQDVITLHGDDGNTKLIVNANLRVDI